MELIEGKTTLELLNELIEGLRKQACAFFMAAEEAHDYDLKSMFRNYSQERSNLVADLEKEVRRLGGAPVDHNVNTNVLTGADTAIIAGCAQSETNLLSAYETALRTGLIGNIRFMVQQQLGKIRETQERLKFLQATALQHEAAAV